MTSVPPPGAQGRWGAYSLNPAPVPQAGGDPDPERLAPRLLQAAAGLSVLLLLVVANYALRGDENPFNPIAQAATRTAQMPGSRSTIEAIYTSTALANPVVATGEGVYSARTGRSRVTLSVPSSEFGSMDLEAVGDERTVYVRSDEIAHDLPPGQDWIGIQPWLGHTESTALAGNGDTNGTLEMLRAVDDDVEALGEEEVRGVATERYSGSVDFERYAELLGEEGKGALARQMEALAKLMPEGTDVEVWIDARGIVRKTRMVMTMPTAAGRPALTMDMRIELFDFGIDPEVRLPDPDRVFDATPLTRAELNLFDGSSLGTLRSKPGTPALSAAALRHRANAICASLEERTAGTVARAEASADDIRRIVESGDAERIVAAMRGYALEFIEPLLPTFKTSMRQLARLAPPPQLAEPYERFLRTSAQGGEMLEAMARAFEVGELKLADSLDGRSDAVGDASDQAARQIGLNECVDDDSGEDAGTAA